MKLEHEKDFMYIEFSRIPKEEFLKHLNNVIKEGKYKDLDKRMRWDMYWAIPSTKRMAFVDRNKDATDSHIDTLLKYTMKRYLENRNIPTRLESYAKY